MTDLREMIEKCPVCAATHEAFKEVFCELCKLKKPDVDKAKCKKLLDEIFLERKKTKHDMARELGMPVEDLDAIFREAHRIVFEQYSEVVRKKREEGKVLSLGEKRRLRERL